MGWLHHKGFTLVELMVTVAVLAIFAAIAVPSMSSLIQSNRVQGAADEFLSQLQYARSEAILRNRVVTVENTSGTTGEWSKGIRIYASASRTPNTAYSQTTDGNPLREHSGFNQTGLSIRSSAAQYISFRPNGTLATPAELQLTACFDNKTAKAKQVSIQPSGRIKLNAPSTVIASCTP
ncbi:GspH/FimT family pseudopilin [Pseudomonas sp. NPDC078700]|uniref:GspH/FimT family pseudopilin n=1 Tax=Pseudomonas sp. NPDC078700 TaxID=3364424 RepID=UPI0037CAF250